jgi:glycosyltransferase involved in cell wall biosynthesis
MVDAVLYLLSNPARWDAFSAAARKRAVEAFPTDATVARYRALYERTLGQT